MSSLPEGTIKLVEQLDDLPPLVPDELTQYILRKSGQDCTDPRVVRLVSLAGQRFIAAVLNDTLQICKSRLSSATKRQLKQGGYSERRVLTTEDLAKALREYGVTLNRPPYYVDAEAKDKAAAAPR